jgi:quinol monooxygenase YgiN
MFTRRHFVVSSAVLAVFAAASSPTAGQTLDTMFGLIGKIDAVPGQRDALAAILLQGMADMPGCRSYVVAEDPVDIDALWVTEVWDSRDSHAASLALPSVQDAIREGRPMIVGFSQRTETNVLGGHGLA